MALVLAGRGLGGFKRIGLGFGGAGGLFYFSVLQQELKSRRRIQGAGVQPKTHPNHQFRDRQVMLFQPKSTSDNWRLHGPSAQRPPGACAREKHRGVGHVLGMW